MDKDGDGKVSKAEFQGPARLFDRLVGGVLPQAVNGEIAVPGAAGLGVRLDPAVVRELDKPFSRPI